MSWPPNRTSLIPSTRGSVELLRRECEKMTRIPAEEYMAYTELTNRASDVWHKAKGNNDFASFLPHFAGARDLQPEIASTTTPKRPPMTPC